MHTKLTHADNIYCTPYDKTLKTKALHSPWSSCAVCLVTTPRALGRALR